MPTRWRMPPESSKGWRRAESSRPTSRNRSMARSRRGVRPMPRAWSPKATLSSTVRQGKSRKSWNTMAVAEAPGATPSTATLPWSRVSRPAQASSSVDLPHPLGPRMVTISPLPAVRLTLSSTGSRRPEGSTKALLALTARKTGAPFIADPPWCRAANGNCALRP